MILNEDKASKVAQYVDIANSINEVLEKGIDIEANQKNPRMAYDLRSR